MSAEIEPGWRRASKYSVCQSQGKQLLSTKWYGQEKGVVKGKQNKTGSEKKNLKYKQTKYSDWEGTFACTLKRKIGFCFCFACFCFLIREDIYRDECSQRKLTIWHQVRGLQAWASNMESKKSVLSSQNGNDE